jgi:uncharacterized protein (DUF433 family)
MSAIADLSGNWSRFTETGLYTVPAAARLVAAHQSKVRSWLETYPNSNAEPIIMRELPKVGGKTVLGFLDLIETAFIRHFRALGYSPQTIRKVAAKLRARHDVLHPFATDKRFRADGRAIFEETVDDDGEKTLLNLMNDNFVIAPIVEQSLFDQILYVEDIARQWVPLSSFPEIAVNPLVALGKPAIIGKGIPSGLIYRDFMMVGDADELAFEYGLTQQEVKAAIGFEMELNSRLLH